jgi:plastocyanin
MITAHEKKGIGTGAIIAVVVVVILIAAAGYFIFVPSSSSPTTSSVNTTTTTTTTTSSTPTTTTTTSSSPTTTTTSSTSTTTTTSSSTITTTSNSTTTTTTSSGTPAVVTILMPAGAGNGLNFSPATVTLVVGVNNTVMWTNQDTVIHNVDFSSAPSGYTIPVNWSPSPNVKPGASTTTLTLTVPGTYSYACDYHSWMRATIIVKAAP